MVFLNIFESLFKDWLDPLYKKYNFSSKEQGNRVVAFDLAFKNKVFGLFWEFEINYFFILFTFFYCLLNFSRVHYEFIDLSKLFFEVSFGFDVLSFVFNLFKNVFIFLLNLLCKYFVFACSGDFETDQTLWFSFINILHFFNERSILENHRVNFFIGVESYFFKSWNLKGVVLIFFIIDGLFKTCMLTEGVRIFYSILMVFESFLGYFRMYGIINYGSW